MTLIELDSVSRALVIASLGVVVRSSALALVSGCAVWLLRHRTAELRFAIWRWTLIAMLAMPLLVQILPPIRTPSPVQQIYFKENTSLAVTPDRSETLARRPFTPPSHWIVALPAIYLFIAVALLSRLTFSLARLHRIAAQSDPTTDQNLRELAHQIWLESEAAFKPRLAISPIVSAPVTFETEDFWILLPQSWTTWNEAKLSAVLTHEMAHVKRNDPATLLLASFATCLFWFHPLSWFLRRSLSALAEEACDEVVVSKTASPGQYAKFLIDFAHDVNATQGRIIAGTIAMAGSSSMKRRILHLFADNKSLQRGRRVFTASTLALFAAALYLAAAGHTAQTSSSEGDGYQLQWTDISQMTPEDGAKLEQAIHANPEDLDSRVKILAYYGYARQEQPFVDQLLWFILNQPSLKSLTYVEQMYLRRLNAMNEEVVKKAWDKAIEEHSNSIAALFNAATFFQIADPRRGLKLLRDLEVRDPGHLERYKAEITSIYSAAELQAMHPEGTLNNIQMDAESAVQLRNELAGLNDPAQLTAVGTLLTQLSTFHHASSQFQRGLELIQQAITLDPTNLKFKEALESAEAEPVRRQNYEQMTAQPQEPGVIRIGSSIAEASLISKTDPVYPPAAIAARIQGDVEFTATIGTDGRIERLQLVRGHPIFVKAAKEAVLKRVYNAATQDGKPVPFVTQIIVPFRLTPAS